MYCVGFASPLTPGAETNCSPNKIIGGASNTSCSPIFFRNLQLKVTLQTVRLLLTQNSRKLPSLFSKNTSGKSYILNLIVSIVFRHFFAPHNQKIVLAPMDRWLTPIYYIEYYCLIDDSMHVTTYNDVNVKNQLNH